jgi:ribokinase
VAFILVDDRGENSIAVAAGANDCLTPADVDRASAAIRAADILLVQLEIPLETVRHAVSVAHAAGVPVILNPAPARPLDAGLLAQVAILTPNETEAELLTGLTVTDERSAASAASRLLATGLRSAVITLGRQGALVAEAAATAHVVGYEVTPVDTVAAGDVFNGCLAVAIAEGRNLIDAARFANAAAAIAVTRHGAQASAPRRDEIFQFQSTREGLSS